MQPLLNIAVRAARRAGDLIVRNVDRVPTLGVRSKSRNDFVTEVDHLAERDIIETIRRTHPDHGFLGEESGRSGGDEFVWIIDPLDGTTNFLHGFPVFAVSLAVERRGRLEHGVVYDPMRQELFTASRGEGAQVDGKRIRVSKQATLDGALVGTGFPYRENAQLAGRLHGDAASGHGADGGYPPPRRGGARPGVRRGRPARRVLGDRPPSVGHRRRHAADHRGRRTRRHADRRRVPPGGNVIAGAPKVFDAMIECLGQHVPAGLREV